MSNDADESDFMKQAAGPRRSALAELVDFLRHNKKWWLTPIVVALLLLGLLVFLGGTAAAPFLYTLF
jgi:ABC-type microcin C transport system permease subunit YejE